MEISTSISVEQLMNYFNMQLIEGDKKSLKRRIFIADTNRPGLELAGFYQYSDKKRIVILGDKEQEYIKTLSNYRQKKSFDFLTGDDTPVIIISKSRECPPILKRIARKKNFPILTTDLETYRLIIDITTYLDEALAPCETLHGGLLNVYGTGILIKGESGLGKSEIALELIKKGHLLIADDRVDVFRVHNRLVGKAAEVLAGLLEIRGVGVIDVARMFGVTSVAKSVGVDLVIELETWDKSANYNRIGIEEKKFSKILDIDVPKVVIPVREGRSMAVVIETAVRNWVLQEQGLNSAREFEQRVLAFINKNKEEEE